MITILPVLFGTILLLGFISNDFTQGKNATNSHDAVIAEVADASTISAEDKNKKNYFWYIGGIAVVVVFIVPVLYYYSKRQDRKMTKIFESTIIDDIVSALSSDISSDKNELHKIILNSITNNTPLPLSLKNLLRIEYQLKKENPDFVSRTVVVAINRDNDIVLKKITREISWDDLPCKIRHSFITEQKDTLFYSLYSSSEVNNGTTRSTN